MMDDPRSADAVDPHELIEPPISLLIPYRWIARQIFSAKLPIESDLA
jgi:hypothetical protein